MVDRKARLAGNGLVLAKRRNTTDDRFPTRPKGGTQMLQYASPKAPTFGAVLEKDMPFSVACVWSWNIWVPLNP